MSGGARAKPRQIILRKLQGMLGDDFDPLMKAAVNANEIQRMIDAEYGNALEKGDCEYSRDEIDARKEANTEWYKLAEFFQPKIRSIEVSPGELEDEDGNKVESKLIVEVHSVGKTSPNS